LHVAVQVTTRRQFDLGVVRDMRRDFTGLSTEQRQDFTRALWALDGQRRRGTIALDAFTLASHQLEARYEVPAVKTADDLVKIGSRWGKLTVTGFSKNRFGQTTALCQCDCGRTQATSLGNLARSIAKSCGCLRFNKTGTRSVIAAVLTTYKSCAKQKGLRFELDIVAVENLILSPCFYCGAPPYRVWTISRVSGRHSSPACNGIDRVDNGKGYLKSNSVPCCPKCNYAKRDMSLNEFSAWAITPAEHLRKTAVFASQLQQSAENV